MYENKLAKWKNQILNKHSIDEEKINCYSINDMDVNDLVTGFIFALIATNNLYDYAWSNTSDDEQQKWNIACNDLQTMNNLLFDRIKNDTENRKKFCNIFSRVLERICRLDYLEDNPIFDIFHSWYEDTPEFFKLSPVTKDLLGIHLTPEEKNESDEQYNNGTIKQVY